MVERLSSECLSCLATISCEQSTMTTVRLKERRGVSVDLTTGARAGRPTSHNRVSLVHDELKLRSKVRREGS
jgi:hypothetical protein